MCGSSVAKTVSGAMSLGATNGMPDAPGAPTLPQFPGLTPEEKNILDKQGLSLDQFNQLIQGSSADLAKNRQVLQSISGLFDSQGNLDQNALNDLKMRTQGQLAQAQGIGTAALGYLQNYFGTGSGTGSTGTGATGTDGVAKTQADVYKAALEGTGAVNEATKQAQQRNFIQMKDALAQRGIMVNGDTPEQATSDSTAGQRAIQLFQQNLAAQNSSERLGYIQTLGGQVGNTASAANAAASYGQAATNAQLGYANTAATQSMSSLAPYLSQYQQGLQMLYQPYQAQQLGPYQQQMAQAQANYQAQVGQYNAGMGQAGSISGIIMPSASFMGIGVNPNQGWASNKPVGGASASGGSGGPGGFSMGGEGAATA